MFGLGAPELIVVLIVALLLFGKRLPEVMRGLGASVSEFKKGVNEVYDKPQAAPAPQAAAPAEEPARPLPEKQLG